MSDDDYVSDTEWTIVYNYNQCKAFYGNKHNISQISPCVVECSVCNNKLVNHISEYESTVVEYANGFMAKGQKAVVCTNEGCGFKLDEDLDPLFNCLGYSATEKGNAGIVIGFTVDNEAIKKYEQETDKSLKYGVFVVAKALLGDNDIFANDGTVASDAINVELTNQSFLVFELKVLGFTDEYKDNKLAMGAYVAITDGVTTEYSYLQSGTPVKNEKYCFVSYNDIVGKPSTEEITQ